jgi:DNA processing protein
LKISNKHLLVLFHLSGIGRKTAVKIVDSCDFNIESDRKFEQLIANLPAKFKFSDEDIDQAYIKTESIITKSEESDIRIYSLFDAKYPYLLKQISDPPLFISVKGDIEILKKKKNIAVVGTRKPTEYGAESAAMLGKYLAEKGCNVVSGLALGCDSLAHEACVSVNSNAVGVLAHGLDTVSPKKNTKLAEKILLNGGVLISEYFIGTKSRNNYFVDRDRIQAGLSEAVIIVQSALHGGTMHTAEFCKKYNRTLACMQHSDAEVMNSALFQGNKKLISEGAVPLRNKSDIEQLLIAV